MLPTISPKTRYVVFAFVGLWVLAMCFYPGGNAFDATQKGHDSLHNFLCDLLSIKTPINQSNLVGAVAMNVGVVVLVVGGLLPAWWHVPVHKAWRNTSRILGATCAALTLLICIEQVFALSWSHNVITLAAGGAGILPTIIVAVTDWRSANSTALRRIFLTGTLVAALANFISYAQVQAGGDLTPFVPTAQKVALVCLLGWLFCLPPRPE